MFGEMALVNPIPAVRNSHVIAQTDASLAFLSRDKFRDILNNY